VATRGQYVALSKAIDDLVSIKGIDDGEEDFAKQQSVAWWPICGHASEAHQLL